MEELYNSLFEAGDYTGSFEEFKDQFGDSTKSQTLYNALNESGDYTGSLEDFNTQFEFSPSEDFITDDAASADAKSQEGVVALTDQEIEGTELKSADTSSELQENKLDPDAGIQTVYDNYKKYADENIPVTYNLENDTAQFVVDKVAAFATGASDLLAGVGDFGEMLVDAPVQSGVSAYNYFADDEDYIDQQGRNVISGIIEKSFEFDEIFRIASDVSSRFKTERKEEEGFGILGAIKKENYLEAVDRTISGVFEAAPSVIAAVAGPVGLGIIGASSTGQHYEEKSEKNPEERGFAMLSVSVAQGGIELASELVTRGIFKGAGKVAQVEGKALAKNILGRISTGMFFEGTSEVASQEVNNVIDQMWGLNKYYDKDGNFDSKAALTRVFDTFLISAALGGGVTMTGEISGRQKALEADRMMSPLQQKQNIKLTKEIAELQKLNTGVDNNQIKEKIALKKAELLKNNARNREIVDGFSSEEKVEYLKILQDQTELESEAKNLDLTEDQSELNKKTQEQNISKLNSMYKTKADALAQERKARTLQFAEDAASLGIKSTPLSPEDFNKKAREIEISNIDKTLDESKVTAKKDKINSTDYSKGSGGFFINGEFFMNKDKLIELNQLNVGAHETLHPILNALVGDADQQGVVVEKFKKQLSKEQLDFMEGMMKARRYTENKNTYNKEYLTVFSDAIADKEIKYNETLFTKIGDMLMPLFRSIGFNKLKFDTGKDVYNFMREYSKSAEKGAISKDIKQFVAPKLGVTTDFSKTQKQDSKIAQDFQQELDNLDEFDFDNEFEYDQAVANLEAKIRSAKVKAKKQAIKKEEPTKEKTPQKTYDNEKLVETIKSEKTSRKEKASAEADLVDSFDTMALKAIKYDTRKGDYDRTEVRDYLRSFFPSILKSYKPEEAKFSTWVYNNIAPKAQQTYEKFRKIAEKSLDAEAGTTGSVKETAADTTTITKDTSKTKPKGGTIKPVDLLKDPEVIKQYKQAVAKAFKELNLSTEDLTFGKLTDLAPEVIAKYLKLPLNKVTNPADNLAFKDFIVTEKLMTGTDKKSVAFRENYPDAKEGDLIKNEARKIQDFVKTNLNELLRLMPAENVAPELATVDAEGYKTVKGTGLKIKPSLLKYFYEKTGKRSKGLTSQAEIAKLKKLTKEDFLEGFGITKDASGQFKYVSSYDRVIGQRLKAIVDLVGKLATNTEIRQLEGITETQAQNIAAGKSDVQFSKTQTYEISEQQIDPKTLLSYSNTKKTLTSGQVLEKSNWIFENSGSEFKKGMSFDDFEKKMISLFDNNNFKGDLNENIKNLIKATSTSGNLYEYYMWHNLNNSKDLKSLGIEKLLSKTWNSAVDIEAIDKNGKYIGIEVKKSWRDRMGSSSLFYRNNKASSFEYNNGEKKLPNDIIESINNEKEITSKLKKFLENSKEVDGVIYKDEVVFPFTTFSESKKGSLNIRENLNRPELGSVKIPISQVKKHYANKKGSKGQGVDFIIVGNEMFTLDTSKTSKLSNSLNELEIGATINLRIKPSSARFRAKDGNFIESFNLTGEYGFNEKPSGGTLFSRVVSNGENIVNLEKSENKASKSNNEMLPKSKRLKGDFTMDQVLDEMRDLDNQQTESELQFSNNLNLDKDFNDIIENKTGIASGKEFKKVKAEVVGASKGRFKFLIPPSAEDFVGLLYKTLGKGSKGDAQMAWYKKVLLNPFARAMENISRDRNALGRDFRALKKTLKIVPKNLKKKVPGEPFTVEQAVRVWIWNQIGKDVPGLDDADIKTLVDYINARPDLKTFGTEIMKLNKGTEYTSPNDSWNTGTITTDLLETLNTTKRKQYLEVWQQNVDIIFSEKNLNKLEAAYGKQYRKAMENILTRMKTGRNRVTGTDSLTTRVTDWLTGSIGAIMFFNTRSAVLQTLSAVNFINFGDNNILAAGKAFANQKQYWTDFKKLFNSEFLIERRDGLKMNVNEADIADIAKERGVRGVINKLLKVGFTPTQIADSFAIASGGATFYRNRLNALIKGGMNTQAAEKQALSDFREIAEESQQSSRPDKISQQQAGPLGRVILAFANTPAQYARLMKKAASDLKNRRGDDKTNVSKIIYYGVAQNLIFNALQQALFAITFGEDEEEDEKKIIDVTNGMIDSLLRGTGIGGAVVSTVKNALLKLLKESAKKNPKYESVATELLKISPPISSKITKIKAAGRSYSWDKKEMKEKGFSLDNPAYLAGANVISATTNVPLDRVVKKINNITSANRDDISYMEKIALLSGWSEWQLGIDSKKDDNKKSTKRRGEKRVYTKKVYTRKK